MNKDIKRNEIVVFNWPTDTVQKFFDRSGAHFDKPIDIVVYDPVLKVR